MSIMRRSSLVILVEEETEQETEQETGEETEQETGEETVMLKVFDKNTLIMVR